MDKNQIEEIANVSNKEEQIARTKLIKEKDDLVKALLHYANNEVTHGIKNLIDCECCANYLIDNLGYRKINENDVVIGNDYYNRLKRDSELYEARHKEKLKLFAKAYNQGCKETAKKILERGKYCMPSGLREWIIEQFGVDVGEEK